MSWLEQVREVLKEKRMERDKALFSRCPDKLYIMMDKDVRWYSKYVRFLEDNEKGE